MRVFFCTKGERRVRNYMPKYAMAKEYPDLSPFQKASLTVEAAFVLPVFLFAMLVFLYFMQMARGYEQIQEGLAVAARAASQYGVWESGQFYRYLEENGGGFSYIQGGRQGISLRSSGVCPVSEKIIACAEYKVILPIPFFGREGFNVRQEVKSRVFSGVSFWRRNEKVKKEKIVFVAKYGTVYHFYRNCSYLNPSIRMTWADEVFQKRNKKGGKYKPCNSCMKKGGISQRALYITEEGDYFHSSLGCKGLNRTIYEKYLSEAAGLGLCSKCGG